jgi:dihydropteroate synthase
MTVYVRPLAFSYGLADTVSFVEAGTAGRVANTLAAFSHVELLERGEGYRKCRLMSYQEARALGDPEVDIRLDLIERVRPAFAGLIKPGPWIMGIVNVTPDSFSDGSVNLDPDKAVAFARKLIADGADILDIGGESTRPGADPVPEHAELDRVMPVIEGLGECAVPISIDSRKAGVMDDAIAAGASIVNDVTALTFDEKSLEQVAQLDVPVILMHAAGDPKTMQDKPRYDDVLLDVFDYLAGRLNACLAAGVQRGRICIDPGIGFGKTVAQNLELLRGLALFHGLGVRLALGTSRKSFIGAVADEPDAMQRLPGSIACALAGAAQGVDILRVHDVAETVQALKLFTATLRPDGH